MSWKRTIFAAVALVLVCMAYYLDVTIKKTRQIESRRRFSLADGVDYSAVGEITLINPQGKLHFVRTGPSAWKITEPFEAAADAEIVDTLLINVTAASRNNDFEADNLAEYGLAKPEVELTFTPEKGKQFKGDRKDSFGVQLGFSYPYSGQVYGRYPDRQTVFTVGEHVKNALLRSAADYRRARLFDVDTGNPDQYATIEISHQGKRTVLKNEVGRWKVTEPINVPAERTVVNEFLNKVGLLRAAGFLSQTSDRPTSMALAVQALAGTSPTLTFSLETIKGQAQKLVVAEADGVSGPVLVAQRPGEQEIMVLRPETVSDLYREGVSFRTREMFSLKSEDVGLFTIELGRATTALIRNEQGNWELVGDPEFRVDQKAVNERLASLLKSRVKDYAEAEPKNLAVYSLDSVRRKFAVVSKDKSKTEAIEVGRAEASSPTTFYARRSGDSAVFTVDLSAELNILPNLIADRHIAAVKAEDVDRLELELDGATYGFTLEGGEWKLHKPGQPAPATADLRQLSALFEILHVMEYTNDITGRGDLVVGPSSGGPALSVRVFAKENRELLNMTIGKNLGKSVLVTIGGKRTFEVDRQMIEKLYATSQNLVK